ncbi:hypothetical protein PR048_013685 [Dryococelus australis]|uniref:DUF5641 domain-containing protein n=1 Tax=Dryococelus australis TaxID=614101 RepID=A0ABQ9HTP3_9NEOP|nr:hypothetical protein PR048_013685 [Dryococelus australis]
MQFRWSSERTAPVIHSFPELKSSGLSPWLHNKGRNKMAHLITLVTQIETCPNSRPILTLSNDPSDPTVLSPGHFLNGTAIKNIPQPDLGEVKPDLPSRWQLLQKFWHRWSKELLNHRQHRVKNIIIWK